MPISNSNDTLSALKEALLSEEEPKEQKIAKVVSGTQAKKESKKDEIAITGSEPEVKKESKSTQKSKSSKEAKALKIAALLKEQQEAKSKKTSEEKKSVKESRTAKTTEAAQRTKESKAEWKTKSMKGTKTKKDGTQEEEAAKEPSSVQGPLAKATKAKGTTTARVKAIEKVTQQIKAVEKAPKLTFTKQKITPQLRINRPPVTKVRKIPTQPHISEAMRLAGESATRQALVRVMAGGDLSPSEAVEAVRRLRASLVKRIPSGTEPSGRSIGQEIKAYKSLKDGMQNTPVRKMLTAKGPEMTPISSRVKLQRARPRLSSKIDRSMPRKVVTVKTGPIKGPGIDLKTVSANDLKLVPVEKSQEAVPTLSYGLERVLFNPGVYHLQDPRSRVFNFDPYLQTIMPVNEFDFNALKEYITSSRDESLLGIAKEQKKKYTGSTSSMTAALAHLHFLLSQWRPVNTGMLSQNFPVEFSSFTALQRGPSAVFLRYKDGTYAIDADKQYDTANILSMLGKSMEKLLTLPTEDFEKYRKVNSDQISEKDRNEAETFHYTTIGDFLLRSQLDAYDPRLPGTGMFDLKTRAVVSIRMDTKQYEQGRGYEIRTRQGEWESYEREYYDMIRAAFLKYSLQVRMGRMDGIFVAFHNTERIFGFQYISLPEMDYALHGSEDTTIGDAEFKLSLELLNRVLDRATEKYPEKSLRLHFETREGQTPFTYIFAEPMEEEQIDEIQKSNRAEILKFEQDVLGLNQKTDEELLKEKKDAEWEVLRAKVEASMEKDELDIQEAKEIAENVLEDSEFWDELSPDEKHSAINELVNSAAFNEAEEEAESETVPVDDADEDGDEDEDTNGLAEEEDSIDEDEEVEEEELDEEDAESNEEEIEETDGDGTVSKEEIEEKETMLDRTEIEESREEVATEAIFEEIVPEESHEEINTNGIEKEVFDDAQATTEESVIEDSEARFESLVTESDFEKPETVGDDTSGQSNSEHTETVSTEGDDENTSTAAENSETDEARSTESLSDTVSVTSPDASTEATKPKSPVFAMTLTIRNLVNGEYVERPTELSKDDKWTIEYALVDSIAEERAQNLYEACKKRRSQALSSEKKESNYFNSYLENLRAISQQGRAWREGQNEIDSASPTKRLDVRDGEKVELKDEWSREQENTAESIDGNQEKE
jgi:hypothetical protein